MLHLYQYTWSSFIKDMFEHGFDWTDIEYYWRHESEYEKMLKQREEKNKLSLEEQAEWDFLRSI